MMSLTGCVTVTTQYPGVAAGAAPQQATPIYMAAGQQPCQCAIAVPHQRTTLHITTDNHRDNIPKGKPLLNLVPFSMDILSMGTEPNHKPTQQPNR